MSLFARTATGQALLFMAVATGAAWAIAPDVVPGAAPLTLLVLAALSLGTALSVALDPAHGGSRGRRLGRAHGSSGALAAGPDLAAPPLDPRVERARLRAQVTQAVNELGGPEQESACVEEASAGGLQSGRERPR